MKKNRNKILITILVITIILLILCVIYVMYQMNTQHKEQDDYSKLASSVAPSIAEEVTCPSIDETLADNPIIDCSKHEVLIPIRIEFKSGEITVSVPEWYIEQVKPEF